jgi:hypothetical protein
MFSIDDKEYHGVSCLVDGLSETFSLLEGLASRRTQSGKMWYNIIGTETSHTLTIRRDPTLSEEAWNELWTILSEPVSDHKFTVPYGTNGQITYRGHIVSGTRALENSIDGFNIWGDYSITIVPTAPQVMAEEV